MQIEFVKEPRSIRNTILIQSNGTNVYYISKKAKASELGITTRQLDRRIQKGLMTFTTISNSKRRWFPKGEEVNI